jgi:hypothetical protein
VRIRLDVEVRGVAERHAVVDVPTTVGYRICARGVGTQLPSWAPVTAELTEDQVRRLVQP